MSLTELSYIEPKFSYCVDREVNCRTARNESQTQVLLRYVLHTVKFRVRHYWHSN